MYPPLPADGVGSPAAREGFRYEFWGRFTRFTAHLPRAAPGAPWGRVTSWFVQRSLPGLVRPRKRTRRKNQQVARLGCAGLSAVMCRTTYSPRRAGRITMYMPTWHWVPVGCISIRRRDTFSRRRSAMCGSIRSVHWYAIPSLRGRRALLQFRGRHPLPLLWRYARRWKHFTSAKDHIVPAPPKRIKVAGNKQFNARYISQLAVQDPFPTGKIENRSGIFAVSCPPDTRRFHVQVLS